MNRITHRNIGLRHHQGGVTLVELMVGMLIGLLVIGVAGGALLASRGISGTVSDASNIQQQASYALRVIGMQLRQAGSIYLDLGDLDNPYDPVQPELKVGNFDRTNSKKILYEDDDELTVGFSRYANSYEKNGTGVPLARNCIGETGSDESITSVFEFDAAAGELKCGNQPIINNVANFQLRYVLQEGASDNPDMAYGKEASEVSDWHKVRAVEVCLVLYGSERISMPANSTYMDCDGTAIDMPTIVDTSRQSRMHLVFRNLFQLRNMDLPLL